MRVAVLSTDPDRAVAAALGEAGVDVVDIALPGVTPEGATAALTTSLRAAEEVLAADPRPEALVVAGEGDEALAAALVAVKLGVPTAWLRAEGSDALVGQVADLRLDANSDAAALAAAVRELAAPRITAP